MSQSFANIDKSEEMGLYYEKMGQTDEGRVEPGSAPTMNQQGVGYLRQSLMAIQQHQSENERLRLEFTSPL